MFSFKKQLLISALPFLGMLGSPLRAETIACPFANDTFVSVTLGGENRPAVDLNIPREHIWSLDVVPGEPRLTLLLAYLRDSLAPFPLAALDTVEQRQATANLQLDYVSLLLQMNRSSMSQSLQALLPDIPLAGNETGIVPVESLDLNTTTAEPGTFDRRVYWHGDNISAPSDIFLCTEDDSPLPLCDHFFDTQDLQVQIFFPRLHLTDWKNYRAAVEKLVSCFREGTGDSHGKKVTRR